MLIWVAIFGVLYLCLLFLIASKAEKIKNKEWLQNKWIHTFALAVFCTTWTYYGSVGRVTTNGIDFLAIYLGPTIMLLLGYGMLRKIFKISKELHITSLADFLSVRFGKNFSIGAIVTICCIIALIPYIGLQLKAIVSSLQVFVDYEMSANGLPQEVFTFIAVGTTVILCIFSILYGARKLEPTETNPGLMAVIAFESIFKLAIFLLVGFFITFILNGGFSDILTKINQQQDVSHLYSLSESSSITQLLTMMLLSGMAFVLLPRQFHVSFIENTKLSNIKFASWSLPTYLVLINIFILPIAFYGLYMFYEHNVHADMYVIAIPYKEHQYGLSILTWLGGLSAATGMIIVETIALSIMVSNNIVTPLFFATNNIKIDEVQGNKKQILMIRRMSIVGILLLSLSYYLFLGQNHTLVSIGLISFGALANFAPTLILSLYWKSTNRIGAIAGILVGFLVWFYTSVIPQAAHNQIVPPEILTNGPFDISWLNPYQLFGLNSLDPLSHSLFWSIFFNTSCVIIFSLMVKKTRFEAYYAELFVDNERFDMGMRYKVAWKGNADIKDLYSLLGNFIGQVKARSLIQQYAEKENITIHLDQPVHNKLVVYTERLLGGVIGSAAARILMKRTTEEEEISYREMYAIIKENQQVKENNLFLKKQSLALKQAKTALLEANENLQKNDEQKNEFLYTVTHELKTPLTSIIALSEIVHDNPDIEEEQRTQYLGAVIKEANRLSYLINQVLKLEKFEAGKQRLNLTQVDLSTLISETIDSFEGVLQNKNLTIKSDITNAQILISIDKELIQQVLVNLIGNAIKFAQSIITIRTFETPYEWEVWVSDDGKGIAHVDKELIFDKFYQAKNQNIKKPEGSGLGLAICKKIIDLHKGEIRVDTNQSIGAHFVFTLPKSETNLF